MSTLSPYRERTSITAVRAVQWYGNERRHSSWYTVPSPPHSATVPADPAPYNASSIELNQLMSSIQGIPSSLGFDEIERSAPLADRSNCCRSRVSPTAHSFNRSSSASKLSSSRQHRATSWHSVAISPVSPKAGHHYLRSWQLKCG